SPACTRATATTAPAARDTAATARPRPRAAAVPAPWKSDLSGAGTGGGGAAGTSGIGAPARADARNTGAGTYRAGPAREPPPSVASATSATTANSGAAASAGPNRTRFADRRAAARVSSSAAIAGSEARTVGAHSRFRHATRNAAAIVHGSIPSSGTVTMITSRSTSAMISMSRRSTRAASVPPSGAKSTAGSSISARTPPTACARTPASSSRVSIAAIAVRAGTVSHIPSADRDTAVRSRRSGPTIECDEGDETPGGGEAAGCGRGAPVLVMSVRVSARMSLGAGLCGGSAARCRLLRRLLLAAARRHLLAPLGEQLRRPLQGDRLDLVALAQARVRLPVGDVRAEPALLHDHRLLAERVVAQLPQRRRGRRAAPALLRLREQLLGLLQRDREQFLFGVQRAAVAALLDVRAEPPVVRRHRLAVQLAERPRQRQQLQRVVQRDRVERHRLEQRAGARLRGVGLLRPLLLLAL